MIASPLSSQSFAVLFFSQPNGWRFPIRFRSNAVALEGQRRQPLEIVPFLVQLHLWHLDEGRWWAAEEDAFWRWGEIWFDVKRVADLTDVFFFTFSETLSATRKMVPKSLDEKKYWWFTRVKHDDFFRGQIYKPDVLFPSCEVWMLSFFSDEDT